MKWTFWKPEENPVDSPGVKDAKARVERAHREREEMEKLKERHREIRKRNHLGQSAIESLRWGDHG